MSLWLTAPVAAIPRIELARWMLICTEVGEVHAVGYNAGASEGRVSSPLLSFDVTQRTGTTRSGRTYALLGPPGVDADAQYVFDAWLRINRVLAWTEVTVDVLTHGLGSVVAGRGATEVR